MNHIRILSDDGVDEVIECKAVVVFAVQGRDTTITGFGPVRVLHGILTLIEEGYYTGPIAATMAALETQMHATPRKERKPK